jgi:hypothetical protein
VGADDGKIISMTITGGINPALHQAIAGDALAAQEKNAEARLHYAAAVDADPSNARYHWQLGVCEDKLGHNIPAMQSFERAAQLDPQFAFAHASMGSWFLNNGIVESALEASARAMELMPGNHSIMQMRARVLEVAGETDAAWQMVRELLGAGYAPAITVMLYARLARQKNQAEMGLALVEKRIAIGGISQMELGWLHLAAAQLLDSLLRYDEAFARARMGNELCKPAYEQKGHERTFDELIAYFTRERLAKIPRATERDQTPVFIVGMPRSGTSLVEQILASHPQIHGGGELEFMYQIWAGTVAMVGAGPQDYPQCLDRLTLEQIDGMSQIYLQPLRAMNPQAKRITDKLPLNFLHLGLIAILFPGARIIHCRRDAMDTCLSCYMSSFREGHEFKYDLSNLGHFYRQYERLIAHWKANLDLPMLEVQYEELVTDNESQSRRIIEFLALRWDDRCLQFARTARPVATASLHQVRQPIYRSSMQRWRHYEKYLANLKMSLASV